MPGVATQSCFGNSDYVQNMALDSSFFAIGNDLEGFGSMLDTFIPEQSDT